MWWKDAQWSICGKWLRIWVYSREYMPLPGPPDKRKASVQSEGRDKTDGSRKRHTCREAAATAQQYLHGRYGIDIVIMDADTFECKIYMVELRVGIE